MYVRCTCAYMYIIYIYIYITYTYTHILIAGSEKKTKQTTHMRSGSGTKLPDPQSQSPWVGSVHGWLAVCVCVCVRALQRFPAQEKFAGEFKFLAVRSHFQDRTRQNTVTLRALSQFVVQCTEHVVYVIGCFLGPTRSTCHL